MEQSNNSGVYLRYAIGIGAIGALAYLLYKKGLIFKSVKQKRAKATLPKLLEKLGPTFKIVGTSAKYGDEAIADSINIGGTDYYVYRTDFAFGPAATFSITYGSGSAASGEA